MYWTATAVPSGNPFAALRRDFERQLGLDSDPMFAAMTVSEHAEKFSVVIDLPGLKEHEISVVLQENEIVVEGERTRQPQDGETLVFNDRSFSRFRRVLKLREPVDRDSLTAELHQGVLTLTVRRIQANQPRTIPVKSVSPAVVENIGG
jgi:HSP20 family protein